MQELTHYINGAHVKGTSGRFADVMNPATGEVQAKCPLASAAEMDKRCNSLLLHSQNGLQQTHNAAHA